VHRPNEGDSASNCDNGKSLLKGESPVSPESRNPGQVARLADAPARGGNGWGGVARNEGTGRKGNDAARENRSAEEEEEKEEGGR
jgi:hypothetical protein